MPENEATRSWPRSSSADRKRSLQGGGWISEAYPLTG